MKNVSIDIETYSDRDLSKCGVYKYAESEAFEILLFGYSVDGGPVEVCDISSGEKLPDEILDALVDENVTKWAFNASFERICISYWLKKNYPKTFKEYGDKEDSVGGYLNPISWRCTLVWSAYLGLPLSLKGVGTVLGLDKQKMDEGKDLIRYFCVPCKPTKSNGGRTRNLPVHAPEKWTTFVEYNKRDVEVEMAIKDKLKNFPVPEFVWDEYHLDQKINDRGILVDIQFAENAIAFDEKSRAELTEQLGNATAVENPNSVAQIKKWLADNNMVVESLGKKEINALIKQAPENIQEVLKLRQKLAKSSVKKYQAMENAACKDGRCRGMFMFYGANRTGRWAGRIVQLQNLPQNHLEDLDEARNIVRKGKYEMMDILYDDIPDTLSQLIRTAFIPKPGYQFYVADFSAIEARVIAHLAGEKWRSEVFKNGGDIYCASAQKMFHVPVEKHGQNSHLRQKGKIAELALGYGGGVGAMKAMGAIEMGIPEHELDGIVKAWRDSNPNITTLWWDVDRAAKKAIEERTRTTTHGIVFECRSGMLFIYLPSGRMLSYVKPRIEENMYGGTSITYEGVGATKKWERLETYGPKLVENIVQAISRDILCYAMHTLSDYYICGSVHDELIIECKESVKLEDVCALMGKTPPWFKGIILRADGYTCPYYKKD